jgi:sporulation protein YlmC with PRC-barrel domain
MRKKYCLVRDLLDYQIVDQNGLNLGKIDGIAIHVANGEQPRVTHLETGGLILARRLGRRWERFAAFMTRRFGVRKNPVFRVAWASVTKVGLEVRIAIDGRKSDVLAWERYLDDHLIGRLPFARTRIKED